MEGWDISKSANLYNVHNWGEGYFSVNAAGHAVAKPSRNGQEIDIYEAVRSLAQRGINVPVLLRFDGIIRDRVHRIHQSFTEARTEYGYKGKYLPVYPIKVNQQRHVVDTIRTTGRDIQLGLEVGSKPELIAVLAIHDTEGALLLCNGYKDREYIELALLARRLGRRPIIIVEQLYELDMILEASVQYGIEAEIGIRMKPVAKGSGRWESSGGERAKFGLNTHEIVEAIDKLKSSNRQDWLKLVHYHIGSQITSISAIRKVLNEATRVYVEIARECPSLSFLDVGGGLAVDYDGSKTNFDSSADYTVEEYARTIVYGIQEACAKAGINEPDIITESGRALIAHHACLVIQVIDSAPTLDVVAELPPPPSDHEKLKEVVELYAKASVKNCHETLHDAVNLKDEIMQCFISDEITLREKAYADQAFWYLMAKLARISSGLKYLPEDLEKLKDQLRDTYFCNFSVFQSLPDSWAIDQLFPIMPLNRLNEEPSRRGIIADMSCDSDGQIDRFIDLKDVNCYLPLHPFKQNEPYYLGIFLVGAYQEILGDLHNLFGDTNAVHIDLSPSGELQYTHIVEGDTTREALAYVQYEVQDLNERLRLAVEKALRENRLSESDAAKLQRRYKEALEGYTYLYVDP